MKSVSAVSCSDLISCTRQEGLNFDKLPWCRERWFHETPHEGVDQSCGDTSPPLHLIQDLGMTAQSVLHSWNINTLALLTRGFRASVVTPPPCLHADFRNKRHLFDNNNVFFLVFLLWKTDVNFFPCRWGWKISTRRAHLSVLVQTSFCLESWIGKQCYDGHVIASLLFSPSRCFHVFLSHTHGELPRKSNTGFFALLSLKLLQIVLLFRFEARWSAVLTMTLASPHFHPSKS